MKREKFLLMHFFFYFNKLLNNFSLFQTLKKHEYFGKFGKIHKVVINQSTSYAGSQVNGFGFTFINEN